MTLTLTARFLFPVAGPPLAGGVVTIDGPRVAFVGPAGARRADLDLGNAAIIPGLVNAHTHLDLSGLRGQAPPSPDFTGWLRQVIAHRRRRTPAEVEADVRGGLAEAVRTGTTLIGDISADGGSWKALATSGVRSVIFREMLGLPSDRAGAACAAVLDWYGGLPVSLICRPGVSPHAPYSANRGMFNFAPGPGVPVATHLAESPEELELVHRRGGPFVPFLSELGVYSPEGLAASFAEVIQQCLSVQRPALFVHCNYLPPDALQAPSATVVYCPRTHAAFGHPPHLFRHFLAHGVRVALGTDSLASNPDLDLLAEARFVHRWYPDFSGAQLLRMATLSGAEALGWEDETGSLEPGKSADLAVVPLPDRDGEPHELLFGSDSPVSRVMCRGQGGPGW